MRCKQCRKKISNFAKECPYCHMQVAVKEEEISKYLKKINHSFEKEEKKREGYKGNHKKTSGRRKRRTYVTAACLFAIALMGGKYVVENHNKWNLKENTITYLSEDKLVTENLETGRKMNLNTFELSEFFEGQKGEIYYNEKAVYREFPEKGRIYYAQIERKYATDYVDSFQLCKKDTKNIYSKPEVIDESVLTIEYDKEGNAYYVPMDQQKVVKYDGSSKKEVAFANATALHYNERKNVLFVMSYNWQKRMEEENQAEVYTLSAITLSDMSVHKISDYTDYSILFSEDGTQVCYLYKNILYRYDVSNGTITEIARNVAEFQFDLDDNNKLYYIKYDLQKKTYYDFVIDKYKEQDEGQIKNPESQCISRKEERKSLQSQLLYLMTSELYCYEDGKNEWLADGVGQLYPVSEREGLKDLYLSVNKQVTLDTRFEMSEFGIDSKDDIEQFYMDPDQYGEESVGVVLYSLYDTTGQEELRCDAMAAYAYEEYCVVNGEVVGNDAKSAYYKGQKKKTLSRTAGEVTCWYDTETGYLNRALKDGTQQKVASDVYSYMLQTDGNLLVMAGGEDSFSYDLYEISLSGKKRVLAKTIWGLLGKDVCVVSDYSEVEQRTP